MSENVGACPICSGAMRKGTLMVMTGDWIGSISWRSEAKTPHTIRTFWRNRKKAVQRFDIVDILDAGYLHKSYEVEAWYCPQCRKVHATMDAPNPPHI